MSSENRPPPPGILRLPVRLSPWDPRFRRPLSYGKDHTTHKRRILFPFHFFRSPIAQLLKERTFAYRAARRGAPRYRGQWHLFQLSRSWIEKSSTSGRSGPPSSVSSGSSSKRERWLPSAHFFEAAETRSGSPSRSCLRLSLRLSRPGLMVFHHGLVHRRRSPCESQRTRRDLPRSAPRGWPPPPYVLTWRQRRDRSGSRPRRL